VKTQLKRVMTGLGRNIGWGEYRSYPSYRQLIGNVPFTPAGIRIELNARQADNNERTYLCILSVEKDIILNLEVNWDYGVILLSKRMNKEWTAPIRIETSLIKEGTQIVLSFAPSSIDIITEGRHCCEWPLDLPFNEISTLDVSGAWSTELASSFDIKLPSQILRELPHGENLLNKHQDDLIFDIGMNNGDDTDFYLKKGFRVISIEAIPTLCAVAAEGFKDYVDCGKLVICNMGVSHSRGELSFFINHNHNEWSSFDRDIASRGHPVTEIKISTATAEDFFSTFGIPYYCKIDIEGLDYAVVNTIANLKEKPRYVSFENGHLGDFEALASAGYDSFQLVEQSAVPQMQLPSPSLEGATITYQFSAGASGPFGNDLPGRWWSIVETRAILEKHHNDLAARRTRGYDWWDLHARHGVKNEYHSF
jgi:FkbM family methyltransferase